MKKDNRKTIVVFRKFKENNEVIAIFPMDQYNEDKELCSSYMHVGQHGAASYRLVDDTTPATSLEYNDLYNELKSIGYDLIINTRISKKWFN